MNQGFYGSSWVEHSPSSILLYSFLENSPNCTFLPELHALRKHTRFEGSFDEDLQTDGNRAGRFQDPEPVSDDEESFRRIGAQLAEMGDRLVAEVEPSLIDNLVRQFMVENLPIEEINRHLAQAIQAVVRRMPVEINQERAMLVTAMVLARSVANTVPTLLHRVFVTTVNYINYNLGDYVNNLAPEG